MANKTPIDNKFFPSYKGCIITSKFGMRKHPITGKQKMHNGIDLVATNDGVVGQTDHIMAHSGGVVYSEGYDASAGYFCNIKVTDNVIMSYYHMNARCKYRKGNTVKEGTVIGYMGKTGNVTGAHLHFGIKVDGKWVDPEPYINKEYPISPVTATVNLPVIKKGASGNAVMALQSMLIAMGYDLGKSGVDGSFGSKTDKAVIAFQHDHKLKEDGCVGPATWTEVITKFSRR